MQSDPLKIPEIVSYILWCWHFALFSLILDSNYGFLGNVTVVDLIELHFYGLNRLPLVVLYYPASRCWLFNF